MALASTSNKSCNHPLTSDAKRRVGGICDSHGMACTLRDCHSGGLLTLDVLHKMRQDSIYYQDLESLWACAKTSTAPGEEAGQQAPHACRRFELHGKVCVAALH